MSEDSRTIEADRKEPGDTPRATSLRSFARWMAAGVLVVGTGRAARVGSGRLCFKREGCPDCPAFAGCGRSRAVAWRAAHEEAGS